MKNVWIGIDTGGTFTDLVLTDLDTNTYCYHKLPTTTADPAKGILDGIAQIIEMAGRRPADIGFLVLGTTLATNAVLERKTARTGMLTTRGFRDVLELARQRRPHYFNLDILKPPPPVARDCRIEVDERIDFDGSTAVALSEEDVRNAVDVLRTKGVEAIAVCLVHSYANPAHEERAKELVRELMPDVYLCTSSGVLAEFREYERFATTAVNASLMPIVDRYLTRFERGVQDLGIACVPRVMQSNGGAVSQDAVRRLPINTFFSGPAGGVIGTVGLGQQLGIANLITFDMGGTSTDVCLIKNGVPSKKNERDMGGFPVRTRTLDIHTIGAGGGSIAWIDAGGLLKVGPQSAGAYPGPVAYGRGGEKPTVTDANVVLGRLNPRSLLGGRMAMFPERAHEAMRAELGERIGADAVKAAAGILEIINVNMIGALRVISVEQGEDPRDFTLVAFGGAGPLHAAEVALSIGMRRVLVPPRPGLLSAIGQLHADVRGDFSLTRIVAVVPESLPRINAGLAGLQAEGERWLAGESEDPSQAVYEWHADLRYAGQSSELALPLEDGRLDADAVRRLLAGFHEWHEKLYGYRLEDHPVELVTLRLSATARRPVPPLEAAEISAGSLFDALLESRDVWFADTGYIRTPVYDRVRLPADCRLRGPAIIEQMDTTVVVPPGAWLSNDNYGCLLIELETAAS